VLRSSTDDENGLIGRARGGSPAPKNGES